MARFLIWAAPLFAVAAPAMAQQASTDTVAAASASAAAPAKPKKICRTQQITGRRIAQSQCYTATQWADYDRAQAEAAKQFVNDVTGHAGKYDGGSDSSGGLSTAGIFGLAPPR
jgi:hypothetical protein